jgi:thymidine phosphorylase
VELTVELGAEMLLLGQAAADLEEGRKKIREAIADGRGLRRFLSIVRAQGGDPRAIEDLSLLPRAPHVGAIRAGRSGFVTRIQSEEVGLAAMALGAGRASKEDVIDPAVGFVLTKKVQDEVREGDLLAEVHAADERGLELGKSRLLHAYEIGEVPPRPGKLLLDRIG